MPKKLNFEYVKKFIENEGYVLLSDKYINTEAKLKIQCPKGHIFKPTFHNFKDSKSRCPICSTQKNTRHTIEYVESIFNKYKYKVEASNYKSTKQKLKTTCPSGHIWYTTFYNFNRGRRCKTCFNENRGKTRKLTFDDVKKVFKEEGYIVLTENYENVMQKLDVICPEGHKWSVSTNNFKNGCRCSKCPSSISKAELEIFNFLKKYFPDAISGDRGIINPLELDIVIPSKKLAIEYCGIYWHSDSIRENRNYHLNKLNLCNSVGYKLITIFEDEWNSKKDMVKNILKSVLDIREDTIIYARSCFVKNIDRNKAKNFFEDNHLQGYIESSVRLGLYYNNELVSAMCFGKSNISRNIKAENNIYELSRFCSKNGYRVIGAVSKLFKTFLRSLPVKKLYSYSDKRWFDGNIYKVLGFKKIKDTPPSYWYVANKGYKTYKKYHRYTFRKNVLNKKLKIFDPNKTEYENMLSNGYKRLWDCGSEKYEYTI